MDLVDLKESKKCKVKIKGKDVNLVSLIRKNGKYFAMIEGGYTTEVDKETFDKLNEKLGEHIKKHFFNK